MTKEFMYVGLIAGLLFGDGLAFAHHGRGNRYDMDSEIELSGIVRELVWRNPHVAILLDVESDADETVTWVIEHSNVSTLARQGYYRNSLRPGQEVTAFINPGSAGNATGLCQRIVLDDGTVIFVRGASVD
jgi:hypothetical protein